MGKNYKKWPRNGVFFVVPIWSYIDVNSEGGGRCPALQEPIDAKRIKQQKKRKTAGQSHINRTTKVRTLRFWRKERFNLRGNNNKYDKVKLRKQICRVRNSSLQ